MEYLKVALAANLNRAADTLERLANNAGADPTTTERLEEMQAHVDAGAAVWGAVLRGLLKIPEIVEHVDELTACGFTEPDSLVGSGQESANLFIGVMTDFVYPMGEAVMPTYSLADEWEPSDDHHAMYRRNELRAESTGCRLLARLIETGGTITPAVTGNEERDKWIYKQCSDRTVPFKTILARLAEQVRLHGWETITSIPGVKSAAERYARAHSLAPIPPRQNGRPKK